MSELGPGVLVADRFVIDGPALAEGATGTLWPAWDEIGDRGVALKVVHAHLLDEPAALARLQSEAGAASRMRHAHLLVVHGLWTHAGRWVLVEERLHGPALDAGGVAPLSTGSTIAVGLQIVAGLRALHEAGLVHGDVRPGHVLLADRGAVLLGMGQAAVAGARATRPGQTAPEVAAGGPPGVAADLYGLGVSLHYALTGRLPFPDASPWELLGRQRRGPPERPPGPAGLAALIIDLLHPMPDRRPPDVRLVAHALRQLQEDPDTPVRWRPTFAPVRLGGAWAVHGTDPDTGGPALVAARLSKRRALALSRRLRAQGWEVRADPEGLSGEDLLAILLVGLVLGVVLPVIGFFFGAWAIARGRSTRARPGLSRSLPPVRARVPPRVVASGTEHALVAGALLLVSAVLLALEPLAALVPVVLLVALIVGTWRQRRRDAAADLLRARVEGALDEARLALEEHAMPLDASLSMLGELEAAEMAWRAGRTTPDAVLHTTESVRVRTSALPAVTPGAAPDLRDAMDRVRAELDPATPRA